MDGFDSWIIFPPLIIIFFVLMYEHRLHTIIRQILRVQKRRKGVKPMSVALRHFIGKYCAISIAASGGMPIAGTVLAVDGNWMTVQVKEKTTMLNTDFILQIQEKKKAA